MSPNGCIFKKPLIFCHDVNSLVQTVEHHREKNYNNIKIGLDSGGGFLKVCLTLNNSADSSSTSQEPTKRHTYSEGVTAKSRSDGSVKRLFIIALAPDVPENYRNLLSVWTHLKLDMVHLPFTIAADLKMASILMGLMGHGSNHPCTWCEVSKDNLLSGRRGRSRTLGSIRQLFGEWHGSDAKVPEAKNFGNVIHLPIPKQADNTKVLDLIPPLELHILIGPVTTIFDALKKVWPDAEKWANASNVERQAYHGGILNGNGCIRLLKHVDALEEMRCSFEYVDVLRKFKSVVDKGYGMTLDENFLSAIEDFSTAYKRLGIRITPKVHAVMFHVSEFCETHDKGLGFWSEQASESVHSDFEKIWVRYKVGQHNKTYDTQLLKAVQDYCNKHL